MMKIIINENNENMKNNENEKWKIMTKWNENE